MKKVPPELVEKLLAAVAEMPEGSGFDVSVDEVAHISGVPRATLYYYFSGKDDLVQFYLNDLMERTRVAIQKAAATEGSVEDRLAAVMTGVIGAFAEYPRLCMELAAAMKHGADYAEVMAKMDQAVMSPLREVLIEGKAENHLAYADVDTAANAIMGALHMVSMTRLLQTGHLDADEVASAVVPQLINGLLPR